VISKGLAAPYSFMLSLLVGMKIQIGSITVAFDSICDVE